MMVPRDPIRPRGEGSHLVALSLLVSFQVIVLNRAKRHESLILPRGKCRRWMRLMPSIGTRTV